MNNSSGFPCGVPPRLFGIPSYVNNIQGVLILLVAITSLVLNGLTIFLIVQFKKLHQRAFYLALQICVLNFLFTGVVHVTSVIASFAEGWPFVNNFTGCQAVGFVHDALVSARYLFALVLGIDRLLTVFCPFWYPKHGAKVAIGMSVVLWLWCIFRSTLPLLLKCFVYIPTFKSCSIVFGCSDQCYAFGVFAVTFIYLAGTFIPFFLYIALFWKARRIQKQLANLKDTSGRQWMRHNWRAIVTFLILFIALICCSLPPFIIFLAFQIELRVVGRPSVPTTVLQLFIGRIMFLSLTAIDPIVILRNRDVREVLKFRRHRRQRMHMRRFSEQRSITNTSSNEQASVMKSESTVL